MPDLHAQIAEKIVAMIHAERIRMGWSQETLAVSAGVSNSCVRHLEHQRSKPTLITMLKLAAALDLDLATLLRDAQADTAPKKKKPAPSKK